MTLRARQVLMCLTLAAATGLSGAGSAVLQLPDVATLAPTLELRQAGELVVPFQSGLPLPTYEPQSRPQMELSDGWVMRPMALDHTLSLSERTPAAISALEAEGGGAHEFDFDDRRWERTRLPAVANPPEGRPAQGVWYRRRVGVPPLWRDRRLLLHCLAANYVADVWVNGSYVGYHEGGFTPFSFDISDHVKWGEANLIAVRVDNPGWLPRERVGLPSQEIVPYGPCDWWNATGVLRDIYLEAVPATALVRADVRCESGEGETVVRVATVVRNAREEAFTGRLAAVVYEARVGEANLSTPLAEGIAVMRRPAPVVEGEPGTELTVAGNTVLAWRIEFSTSELRAWSPQEPNLYVLAVRLEEESGKTVDELFTQFGLRSLEVDAQGPRLLLNGEPVVLAGVGRMEDDGRNGRAVSFRDALRVLLDLRTVKWVGGNFLRMGHFVNHPLTAVLADRMGLVCWEEIPVSWFDARGLAVQWERRRIARQMFMEMIYQDYNRPSVGFWGMCHESGWGEVQVHYLRDLADIGRYLDGTRLLGQSAGTKNPGAGQWECDVQGYALEPVAYPGADLTSGLLAELARLAEAAPDRPMIITEFGVAAGGDLGGQERQAAAARTVVRALGERPYVAGWSWWSLADYQGPEGMTQCGLVSRDRRKVRPVAGALREEYEALRAGQGSGGEAR